jgi:hypothetical protein
MPKVKSMDRITAKWVRQSASAQPEYEAGVANPKKDWASATSAAEASYKTAVVKAANENRFGAGVRKAGNTKWQQNTLAKGPGRWTEGINLSQDAYTKGFQPYRQALESLTLPVRGPKGDPNNIQRVALVAKTLYETKQNLRKSS